jgi:hypothetical protein
MPSLPPYSPTLAVRRVAGKAEECAPRNLAAVFNDTSLLPRKRRHPDARDVVRCLKA